MNDNELGIYILLGGIAGFALVVTMVDWCGRRQRRHQKH